MCWINVVVVLFFGIWSQTKRVTLNVIDCSYHLLEKYWFEIQIFNKTKGIRCVLKCVSSNKKKIPMVAKSKWLTEIDMNISRLNNISWIFTNLDTMHNWRRYILSEFTYFAIHIKSLIIILCVCVVCSRLEQKYIMHILYGIKWDIQCVFFNLFWLNYSNGICELKYIACILNCDNYPKFDFNLYILQNIRLKEESFCFWLERLIIGSCYKNGSQIQNSKCMQHIWNAHWLSQFICVSGYNYYSYEKQICKLSFVMNECLTFLFLLYVWLCTKAPKNYTQLLMYKYKKNQPFDEKKSLQNSKQISVGTKWL